MGNWNKNTFHDAFSLWNLDTNLHNTMDQFLSMLKCFWNTSSLFCCLKPLVVGWNSQIHSQFGNHISLRFNKACWEIPECLQNYYYVKGNSYVVLHLEPVCPDCLKMKDATLDALFTGLVKALENRLKVLYLH